LDKQSNHSFDINLQRFLRYALCLLMFVAPFLRGLYFEDYFLPFVMGITILFIIFVYEQFKQRESGFFNHHLDWAILALLLAYLFSLFTAVNTRAAIGGLMKYAAYFMVFWMCYRVARQNKGIESLYLFFYLAGLGTAVFGLLVYSGFITYPYIQPGERIAGTLEYANTFGAYLGAVSMLGWSLILSNKRLILRAALAGGNALLLMAMLGSLSRGAWLLYPFAVIAFIAMVGRGKRFEASAILLASLIPGFIIGKYLVAAPQYSNSLIYMVSVYILASGSLIGIDYLLNFIGSKIKLSGRNFKLILIASVLAIVVVSLISYNQWNSYFTAGSLSRLTNITLQDENVQLRFEYNRDAIKIIKDYPLTGIGAGGWEALYHQYASHLYWSSITHNYFMQTWIEAGTFGFLGLMAVWLAFIHLLWKYWKIPKDENSNHFLFWGGTIAIFLLATHSIIDFDMSYPAVAFLLFGLIGTLQGMFLNVNGSIDSQVLKQAVKKRKQPKTKNVRNHTDIILVVTAVIIALILLTSAASFWIAGINFRSAQKILNQDPNQALILLNKSMQYDSLNASYVNQTASFYSALAVSNGNQATYQQALNLSQKAVKLEPYNIKILNNVNGIYLQFGQLDQAINISNMLIRANPYDPSTYENLASTMVWAGIYQLEAGQRQKAQLYWTESLNVINQVPSGLEIPAVGFNLTSGQANLLLGNKSLGEQQLNNMLTISADAGKLGIPTIRYNQVETFRIQARIWLAASLQISGKQDEGQIVIEQIPTSEQESAKVTLEKVKAHLQKAT